MRISLQKEGYKFTFEVNKGVMKVTSYRFGKFLCSWSVSSPSSHVPLVIEHIIRDVSPAFPTEWYYVCIGYLNTICDEIV